MIPFESFLFFYILVLSFIPAIILGFYEKKIKYYGIFISFIMLALFIGRDKVGIICFLLFYIGQTALAYIYLNIRKKSKNVWIMRLAVLFSLSPFILVRFSHLFTSRIIGFIGISYITFKNIQILIEIYDGLIKKINIIDFTYFLLFFPSISSGPVDRSRRFDDDINNTLSRKEYFKYINEGTWKIFKGVAYKFIFSSLIYNFCLIKIPNIHTTKNVLMYMYVYSMYLFFDFAGYSSMAIGAGYFFGIKLPENFNAPFISKDMKEFWNRWHMSLSFWFRDFVYTRFVMASLKKKRFKSRYTASYVGFIITMMTMALWHGTSKYYLIYGLYEGVLLALTDYIEKRSKFYIKNKNNTLFKYISIFVTFNLACFGLLLFSGYLFKK